METRTLILTSPITWHDKRVTEVVLREPTAGDFFALGDIGQIVPTDTGSMWIESPAILRAYLGRMILGQDGDLYLGLLSLTDALALRELLMGFFIAARQKASPTPATI